MATDEVLFEKTGHVAVITLNRPEVLNALNATVMSELARILDEVEADTGIRCAVLTGAGDKAFSVGFDLDGNDTPARTDDLRRSQRRAFEVLMRIWNLRIPVISAVNGYAVATGSNLAMLCDVTIASDKATFGEPELRHYSLAPLLLLPYFNGNPKMINYLYYSGDTISAAEALSYGMVAKVVPHEQLAAEAMRMARRISLVAPFAVETTKDSIRACYEHMGFSDTMRYHRANNALLRGASGIPERDQFADLMRSGDVRRLLELRDGPFRS